MILASSLVVFSQHRAMLIICGLLNMFGLLAALAGAVGTCYGGELPFSMGAETLQAPPPAESGGNIDTSGQGE